MIDSECGVSRSQLPLSLHVDWRAKPLKLQSITIFKLVDRAAGEESVEFAKQMIFQRPCDRCQHLKVGMIGWRDGGGAVGRAGVTHTWGKDANDDP